MSTHGIESEMLIVRSGVVVVALSGIAGKTQGIYVAEPGFLINVMRVAGNSDRHSESFNDGHRGYAIADLHACAVPLDIVRTLFRSDPDFAELILVQVTDHYKDMIEKVTQAIDLPGEERIRWLLARIAQAGADPSSITHETIARILGMNRVSVTRLMKKVLMEG